MRYLILVLCFSFTGQLIAQQASFDFLNLASGPHVSALGGHVVSATRFIPALYLENPALLNDSSVNTWTLGYLHHPSTASLVQASGVLNIGKIGVVQISARHFGYGTLSGYDETGNYTGEFESADNVLIIGKAWHSGNYSVGSNLKWAFSNIAGFQASALMIDIGASYMHPEREWNIGMNMRNLGVLINDFSGTASSKLPFEVRVGSTYKPMYMPFRFTLSVINITEKYTYNATAAEANTIKKLTSFLSLGTELVWSDNFQFQLGYNFRNRYELRLNEGVYGAGWSGGFRFRKRDFILEYGLAKQHAGGAVNYLSVSFNVKQVVGLKLRSNE